MSGVYVGGDRIFSSPSYYSLRHYDLSGTQQQIVDLGATVRCLATDVSGNVYVGGTTSTVKKYNTSLTQDWSRSTGNSANYAIAVDSDGNYYVAGNGGVRKYNSAGTEQWSKTDHGSTLYAITIGDDGAIYVGGTRSSSITTRKYSSDGTLVWSRDYSYNAQPVYSLTVDADDNVYVVSEYRALAYSSAGTALWNNNHGATLYAAAVWRDPPADIITDSPALSLTISLGTPTLVVTGVVPGLPMPLGMGIPLASLPPLPPDTPGDPQMIYRGYVSGGDPLEVPLMSIQCRRRRGDSTWLSVQTGFTALRWAALKTRLLAGAELLIDVGYRTMDGSESLGLFLRATITAVDQERTGMTGMITLTGRVIPIAYTNASRPLYGVTRRGLENGRQTARCTVIDPLLRTGDTVDDGLAEWEVGAILYFISATAAWMDVTEDK